MNKRDLAVNIKNDVPKIIWMYCHQGLDQAPDLIKACRLSWQEQNPGWTLNFLDRTNYASYVSTKSLGLPKQQIQAFSDMLRINLLASYGGVWADATCYCQLPLEDWLLPRLSTGFFAFERTDRDRHIDSWFLASSRNSYLTTKLSTMANAYWLDNPDLARHPRIDRFILRYTRRTKQSGLWFTYPVTKVLKSYPYMWLMYLFTELLFQDPYARYIWAETPKLNANASHRVQQEGLHNSLNSELKLEIDQRVVPVYKLNWRLAREGIPTEGNSVGAYLFNQNRPRI